MIGVISLLCSLAYGSEAIDKAIEAGRRQIGVEDQFINYSKSKIELWGLGTELAVLGYGYKSYVSKSIRFKATDQLYCRVYRNYIEMEYRW